MFSSRRDIEDNKAVVIRSNFGDVADLVDQVEQAAKPALPMSREIKNEAETLTLNVVGMMAEEIARLVGVCIDERGRSQLKPGDCFKKELEFISPERGKELLKQ